MAVIHADVGEGGLVAPKLPVQGVDEGGQGLLHVGPDAGGLSDFDVVVIARGQDVVDVAADHDEQIRKPRGPEGGVCRVDRELLHLPQEGVEGFGWVDGQPSAHVQPFQRDVAGGEVEAIMGNDTVSIELPRRSGNVIYIMSFERHSVFFEYSSVSKRPSFCLFLRITS